MASKKGATEFDKKCHSIFDAKNDGRDYLARGVNLPCDNCTAYTMGERAYIKFAMKPARQLIVALKSRKWWWNSGEKAWSTYLDKMDKEWVKSISERYEKYV